MSKEYVLSGENMTVGTGVVLAVLQTAANLATAGGMLELLRVEISQSGTATGAQIRGEIFTRDTAGTLTTTAATPRPVSPLGGVASGLSGNTSVIGGTARCGINSSADSGGAYTSILPFNFSNLNGYLWLPTPEERIIVPPSTVVGVRLLAAPGTTTGWTVAVVFAERA